MIPSICMEMIKRSQGRMKAVLPVRVRGTDTDGKTFEVLAHTLDVTPAGVRLGAIRRELKRLDLVTVLYRQRRMEFRVVWIKRLTGAAEYQVGLQAVAQDKEAWGLNLSEVKVHGHALASSEAVTHASSAI
jgi:hypothetical protein